MSNYLFGSSFFLRAIEPPSTATPSPLLPHAHACATYEAAALSRDARDAAELLMADSWCRTKPA
jgi:hypothetical protein